MDRGVVFLIVAITAIFCLLFWAVSERSRFIKENNCVTTGETKTEVTYIYNSALKIMQPTTITKHRYRCIGGFYWL